jgi:pantoate--beta-alanine ligase
MPRPETRVDQIETAAEMHAWTRARRAEGRTIAFVPTMGALHPGHLALVKQAKKHADLVVASIFVNPTQFDRTEDFEKYPVTLEADLAMLEPEGVAAVYLPTKERMYRSGYATFVEVVGPLADKMCAIARPGHFRGVATVVAKLFNAVQPDVAVFGQKDLQQVLIINRMVDDLDLPIRIVVAPTVREADGLAMSSRNRRLDAAHRQIALTLPRGLELANRAFKAGETSAMKLTTILAEELLQHEDTELDYADVVSLDGFTEVETADERCVLAAAAFVGGVRLIDHVHLGGAPLPVTIDD